MNITVSSICLVFSELVIDLSAYPHRVGAKLQKAEELSIVRMGSVFPLKNLAQVH